MTGTIIIVSFCIQNNKILWKNRDQRDRTDQRDGSPVPFSERPETEEKLTDIFG